MTFPDPFTVSLLPYSTLEAQMGVCGVAIARHSPSGEIKITFSATLMTVLQLLPMLWYNTKTFKGTVRRDLTVVESGTNR